MSKMHFIAIADMIRNSPAGTFSPEAISRLADFCAQQNPAFKRGRWLDYIAGKCGPNGATR
jgi:hypothetical protein